jgi:hypothetical protein
MTLIVSALVMLGVSSVHADVPLRSPLAKANLATDADKVVPIILPLLLDSEGKAVTRPTYRDSANLPELGNGWYGAMGEHPVRKLTISNPWPAYSNREDMQIDLYFPADLQGKRPTVFFISGWHQYQSERYRSLLYFIASQGFNCVFIPYVDTHPIGDPNILLTALDTAVNDAWKNRIDTTRIGYAGHSMGAGLIFYLAQARANWGSNGRFLFPMAAWWGFHLPQTGEIVLPANTNMIVQINKNDSGTDPRQNIDFFLHSNIPDERKSFLYIPGDEDHPVDHYFSYSDVENGVYYFDALEQVGLYRPLESLMRYSFENDQQWKKIGLPDQGDDNYNVMHSVNGINVFSTDDPLGNHLLPIPPEQELEQSFLCSHANNPRYQMCMPCKDSSRDQNWQQCQ